MNTTDNTGKPKIYWLEGVLDYFNTTCPHELDDPRRLGFQVGRQFVGLYIVEMLLKYALDDARTEYEPSHRLLDLFRSLPRQRRRAVERKYQEILANRVEEAWDFQETVDSFLTYLGSNPITDSRYFWERPHTGEISIVFQPDSLASLIYAIFIVLHQYPESGPLERRFTTRFTSFVDSLPDPDPEPSP